MVAKLTAKRTKKRLNSRIVYRKYEMHKRQYKRDIMAKVAETPESKTTEADEEYMEALRIFEEFKKLRQKIGKPIRDGLPSKEEAIRDLYGDGFGELEMEIEREKSRHFTA